ncbi:HAMP domain-containing sensor histidine kinase [Actinoplanes sp. NPDC049316]|uniref:HAMP domain-containing sensor histidine kinase n=1 Tax=Actinoplanes sp. NPDC049316 TaxID=3154727 RepID=UPI0034217CEB
MRIGLRTRVSAAFAVGALLLSACISMVSYELARSTLIHERERTAVRATYFDATVVDAGLPGGRTADVGEVLRSLDPGADRYVLLHRDGQWYSRSADSTAGAAVPAALQEMTGDGEAGLQRVHDEGQVALVVGIPLSSGEFYEVVALTELERTLQLLALVLTAVAIMVAAAGAAVGWYVTRHALRPLTAVAAAARDIADGDLDTRLDPDTEPDLAQLSTSFNHMADQLSRRLQRDRRFAADVSHELRSPLQTLSAAASVVDRRRDGLDPKAAAAIGLITDEVSRFQVLVDDLLELARSDQPADREPTDMRQLVARVCQGRGLSPELLEVAPGTPDEWPVDRRRVEQALGNLLDNAVRYGGGPVAVRLGRAGDRYLVEVDDAGPGVAEEDRTVIFDRFVRGPAANARGGSDGTGLGLSIVAQHAAAHGGTVSVGDRPAGGARFRMELP